MSAPRSHSDGDFAKFDAARGSTAFGGLASWPNCRQSLPTPTVLLALSAAFPMQSRVLLVCLSSLLASSTTVHAADQDETRWSRTLERIAGSVVTIQIDQARAFDTEWN